MKNEHWALAIGVGVALAACESTPASPDARVADDAVSRPECAGGDGVCRYSCVAEDPDCVATAGDGVCVGNAGELCTSDPDCDTREDVCGNGACSATEGSDLCYADCGPDPWPWTSLEEEVLMLVNEARARGIACAGRDPVVLGPLTLDDGMLAGARERAWELAHQEQSAAGPACNGRSTAEIAAEVGAGAVLLYRDPDGTRRPSDAVSAWIGAGVCLSLIDPAMTSAAVAVAYDADRGFALFVR